MKTLTAGTDVRLTGDCFGCDVAGCRRRWHPCRGGSWYAWQKGGTRRYVCRLHATLVRAPLGCELVRIVAGGG